MKKKTRTLGEKARKAREYALIVNKYGAVCQIHRIVDGVRLNLPLGMSGVAEEIKVREVLPRRKR